MKQTKRNIKTAFGGRPELFTVATERSNGTKEGSTNGKSLVFHVVVY